MRWYTNPSSVRLRPGWWLILGLLAGCGHHRAEVAPPQVVVVPGPAPIEPCSPLIGVLGGVGMVILLPLERQQQELAGIDASLARTGLVTDRLRLAMLLTLGDERIRDTERAQQLIEGHTWEDTSYEAVARLILELIEERKARASDRLDLSFALEQERRQRAELEDRLAQIRAIETEMDARDLRQEGAQN